MTPAQWLREAALARRFFSGISNRSGARRLHFTGKADESVLSCIVRPAFAATLIDLFDSAAAEMETPYLPAAPLREQLETLLRRKLRIEGTRDFIDLARVAIAEAVHSPERAKPMIARICAREEGLTVWIRAAQADGRLIDTDPLFASTLLQGQLKAVAFWPQVTMGGPPIDAAQQAQLVEVAVTMFLAYFARTT